MVLQSMVQIPLYSASIRRYYITYQINTTAAVGIGAGSRILLNNTTPIPASILRPALSVSAFNNDVIVNLNAGDTINYNYLVVFF